MHTNPTKFQFMFMKNYTSKEILTEFFSVNDIKIPVETEVKLLGMTIYNKLKFDKNVTSYVKVFHDSQMFNTDLEESLILKKKKLSILPIFNYCPIIWRVCGKTVSKKVENMQERALHFMFNDKVSTYESHLDRYGYTTLHARGIGTR